MGFGIRSKIASAKREIAIRIHNLSVRPNRNLNSLYFRPTDMCEPDKLMLYALVRGLRPKRVLEIGVRWGGGARIISSALEENGEGAAVGIDPETEAFRPRRAALFNRYQLYKGYSPQAVPEAISMLGGPTDFCLIDAMHTHDHVAADLAGVIPHLAPGAHILLHDTFHAGINAAIEAALQANSNLFDCGIITRHPEIGSAPVAYQGLRLLRCGSLPSTELISSSFAAEGKTADLSEAIYNWDHYWNLLKASTNHH